MLPFGNISKRIFTHTASHYASKHTIIPAIWQARKCRRYAGSPPPSYRHSRATECARLQQETTLRKLVAKPRTPHFHSAGRAALQASNSQCRGRGGMPLVLLWGIQRGYSLLEENTPFDACSAVALPFMHVPYRENPQPGGQVMSRPESTWKCRCGTLCPACSPMLDTTR